MPETQFRFGRLLGEVNRKLSDGYDSERILDFLFESLNIIIPYDRIGIALIEGDANSICAKWVRSKVPTSNLRVGYSAQLEGSSLEKILETGQPRIINDLIDYGRKHPHSKSTELILKDGIRSSLTCPLRVEGKSVGVVFFSSVECQTYKNEHIQTYLEIADELSLIVEHGQLRRWFQNDLSRGQNIRMVLHDLKNPLTVIHGYLDVAQSEGWFQELGGDARDIFSILKRNSNYMLELLSQLSELIKLDADAEKIEPREISLRGFVADIAMRAREQADRKEVRVTLVTDSRLPEWVLFDANRIRRVMDNLVSNAVKFSRRGTNIQVAIKLQESRLVFEVTDEGQGIPENEIPKLFREFGRTSVRPTEGESSTGLGLAIAKKIVELHGGQISVRSQVGIGSTFTLWLPLHELEIMH